MQESSPPWATAPSAAAPRSGPAGSRRGAVPPRRRSPAPPPRRSRCARSGAARSWLQQLKRVGVAGIAEDLAVAPPVEERGEQLARLLLRQQHRQLLDDELGRHHAARLALEQLHDVIEDAPLQHL